MIQAYSLQADISEKLITNNWDSINNLISVEYLDLNYEHDF
jgi:hypothetical protein